MKLTASILTGLSLAVLFFAASAHAESEQRITANIPFEFTAGNISFPAGQYEFIRTGAEFYMVRDADGRAQFIMAGAPTQPNELPEKSTLRFNTVDGRHVLTQIWNDRASNGNDFPYVNTSVGSGKRPTIEGTSTDSH